MLKRVGISTEELALYGDIYRCGSCSHLTDLIGVAPFATPGPSQTIPVSHFGDIRTAKLWLILINPKWSDTDPNVSSRASDCGVNCRSLLSNNDVDLIYDKFSMYFWSNGQVHEFFRKWQALLDGVRVGSDELTFANGGICAVDLVKCPTASAWRNFVNTSEGQHVAGNCYQQLNGNRFIFHQLELHKPPILVCAGNQYKLNYVKGTEDSALKGLVGILDGDYVVGAWTTGSRDRLSIGLGSQGAIQDFDEQALACTSF